MSTLKGPGRRERPASASSVGSQFLPCGVNPPSEGREKTTGDLGTREEKAPLPHHQQSHSRLSLRPRARTCALGYLATSTLNCPRTRAQQQSSGPRPPPISAGLIFVSSPIRADAARKFRELSREGPLTWIHPLGVFFSFFRSRGDGSPGRDGLSLGSVLCFGSVESGTQLGRLIGLPEVELLSAAQEDGSYVGVSRPATDAA